MSRAIALFLLLVLPLQISFAVAAEYCGVEKSDRGQHFGHHVDGAQSTPDNLPAPSDDNKPDCQFCALACAHAQASSFFFAFDKSAGRIALLDYALPHGHSPPVFERPPRQLLA
jgi:hypothetical protein